MILFADWFAQLYSATQQFSKHALVHQLVKKPDELMHFIQSALSNIRHKEDRAILRVFVNNGQRYDLLENLRNTSYQPSQDLEPWIANTIGHDDFCVTFNGITKWNDQLHSSLTEEIIFPIVDNLGVPLAGMDTYAFIANEGYTPFGIHDDLDHSLIFHLGPAEKHVWIWPEEDYVSLTGGRDRRFDVENLMEHAEHLVLQPGDCLFIPRGDFHVFENVGYSTFLGFVLFPSDAKKLTNEAVTVSSSRNQNVAKSYVSEHNLAEQLSNQLEAVLGTDTAFDELHTSAMYKHFLLKSNGYIIHKPILQPVSDNLLQDATLSRPAAFPILHHQHDDRLALFIRGRFLEMRYFPEIVSAIELMNRMDRLTYDDLIQKVDQFLPHQISESIVRKIITYRGLLIETIQK